MTENSTKDDAKKFQEIQASLWSILFLLSEQNLAFQVLAAKLGEKEILDKEDENSMNAILRNQQALQGAYRSTEIAFKEKFEKTIFALENPGAVTEKVMGHTTTATSKEI